MEKLRENSSNGPSAQDFLDWLCSLEKFDFWREEDVMYGPYLKERFRSFGTTDIPEEFQHLNWGGGGRPWNESGW